MVLDVLPALYFLLLDLLVLAVKKVYSMFLTLKWKIEDLMWQPSDEPEGDDTYGL